MKYAIILGVLAVIILLIYLRLRPYIALARRTLGVLREVQGAVPIRPTAGPDAARENSAPADRLVPCASCGTWIPTVKAVTLRGTNQRYCSHSCLESAAARTARREPSGGDGA